MSSPFDTGTADAAVGEARLDALQALAQSMLVPTWPAPDADLSAAEEVETSVVLRLDDLVSDPSGEIVLSIGGGAQHVVLESPREVVDRGVKWSHPTGGGESVQGMGFVAFHDGPTLYFPLEVHLTVETSGI